MEFLHPSGSSDILCISYTSNPYLCLLQQPPDSIIYGWFYTGMQYEYTLLIKSTRQKIILKYLNPHLNNFKYSWWWTILNEKVIYFMKCFVIFTDTSLCTIVLLYLNFPGGRVLRYNGVDLHVCFCPVSGFWGSIAIIGETYL